jgi:hypothetical protein
MDSALGATPHQPAASPAASRATVYIETLRVGETRSEGLVRLAATPSPSWMRPTKMCSVPMKLWFRRRASSWASTSTRRARSVKRSNNADRLLSGCGAPHPGHLQQAGATSPADRCVALGASHPCPFFGAPAARPYPSCRSSRIATTASSRARRHKDGLTGPGHVGLTVQAEVGRPKGSFAQTM